MFFADIYRNYNRLDYDLLYTGLISDDFTFSTQLHGGFGNASIKFSFSPQDALYYYKNFIGAHVEVFDQYHFNVYTGFVSDCGLVGSELTLTCMGYYAKGNDIIDDRIYVTNPVTIADIVDDACDLVDYWETAGVSTQGANYNIMCTDPETGAYLAIDFTNIKIKDALERSLNYGYSTSSPIPVYIAFYARNWPRLYTYDPSVFLDYVGWHIYSYNLVNDASLTLSLSEMYNTIYAIYDNQGEGPSKTTAAEDDFSILMYGVKEGLIQNGGNQEGITLATDLRDYALQTHAWPIANMQSDITGQIYDNGFTPQPVYRLRAGERVYFNDLDVLHATPHIPNASLISRALSFVMGTSYNASSDTNTLTIGVSDMSLEILMARLGLTGGLQ